MWNTPTKEQLDRLPRLYETEEIPLKDKIIHMHFFIGGCDWYICEFDGEDMFWGYAILNCDLQNAEWGYCSFFELREITVNGIHIDTDLYWKPREAIKVWKIAAGCGWV